MTLDKNPPGKTSLEYMSIYEENRWWNTANPLNLSQMLTVSSEWKTPPQYSDTGVWPPSENDPTTI
jgi:hypothetical protein